MNRQLPSGPISSRGEFLDALRQSFQEIGATGCREVFLCDVDFADWPLSEPEVLDALTRWALPHRKLRLLAQTYDVIIRRHARFALWRRQWSHVIECRAFEEEVEADKMPTLLLAPGVIAVRLVDRVHVRGSVSRDIGDATRYRELFDSISQRSIEAFPATTLGL